MGIRQSGLPLKYHSLICKCVGKAVIFSFLLASANRWKLALFAPLVVSNRPGRGKKFSQGAGQNAINDIIQSNKELDVMSQIMHPNQLDDSNGSIKVTHNNAMQPAS